MFVQAGRKYAGPARFAHPDLLNRTPGTRPPRATCFDASPTALQFSSDSTLNSSIRSPCAFLRYKRSPREFLRAICQLPKTQSGFRDIKCCRAAVRCRTQHRIRFLVLPGFQDGQVPFDFTAKQSGALIPLTRDSSPRTPSQSPPAVQVSGLPNFSTAAARESPSQKTASLFPVFSFFQPSA